MVELKRSLSQLVSIVLLRLVLAEKCVTPNNETATCKSLYACPLLLSAAVDSTKRQFVHKSNCGGTQFEPMVCCGTQSNFTTAIDREKGKSLTLNDLLPSQKTCGRQHSDDYFHTINHTAITEFPWLALIKYQQVTENETKVFEQAACHGSLINTRYVLTAANCLIISSLLTPVSVYLGDYYKNNETDCIEDSGILECSDPIREYNIEKVTLHPQFRKLQYNSVHDIGLIRLNESVQYTDYIRPICLPLPGTKRAKIGDVLTTSGWGLLKSQGASDVKKRTYSVLTANQECDDKFLFTDTELTENQLCGLIANASEVICLGDTGGPVMYSNRARWHQEAIVLFGICKADYPVIYTDVVPYLGWIEQNLEP